MERPNKKCLTKSEFKDVYPEVFEWLESIPTVYDPKGRERPSRGNLYTVRGKIIPCCDCGTLVFKESGNLYKDKGRDGKYRCDPCSRENKLKPDSSRGYLGKREFKVRYPDKYKYIISLPLVDDPKGRVNPTNGDKYVGYNYPCDICGTVQWINRGNIFKDWSHDGLVRCTHCSSILTGKVKKENGYYDSEEWSAHQRQVTDTQIAKGTFMYEQEIDGIIRHFGGYHLPAHSLYPGTDIKFAMEADWIDLEKKVIIEIDDPGHRKYKNNYHHEKRAYFESLGFRVLNIAVNRKGTKSVKHPHRDGYTFLSLCESHINGTLPRELEILWDDPWYVNG